MTSKRLAPQDVHAVGVAAIRNSIGLMDDAGVLMAGGATRRAYALGVIAVEELAKFMCCRDELSGWTGKLTVDELNKRLRPGPQAHLNRYVEVLTYLKVMAPAAWPVSFADLEGIGRVDLRARERTLYVEVADSGVPMTPDGVDEQVSKTWLIGMARVFAMLARVWRVGLDEALASAEATASVTQTVTRRGPLRRGEGL